MALQNAGGEFDLLLESGDRVHRQEIRAWRSKAYSAAQDRLTLSGKVHLELFTTDLEVTVSYENINEHVVQKTIRLYQNNIPRLFLSMRNSFEPPQAPAAYWSFDQANHPGGPAYGVLGSDVFPAVGYVLNGNQVFGLLTESGWVNGWGRYGYRRSTAGNIPAVAQVDPAILRTATAIERAAGKHFVTLTLGEAYAQTAVTLSEGAAGDAQSKFLGRKGHPYTLIFEFRQVRNLLFELHDPSGAGGLFAGRACGPTYRPTTKRKAGSRQSSNCQIYR